MVDAANGGIAVIVTGSGNVNAGIVQSSAADLGSAVRAEP